MENGPATKAPPMDVRDLTDPEVRIEAGDRSPGQFRDQIVILGDIVGPQWSDEEWEGEREFF